MNYDFFAAPKDHFAILEFIFNIKNIHVYELNSDYGREIVEFKSHDMIQNYLAERSGACHFQLWVPDFSGKPIFRKVDLNPKYCKGHSFRYATDGIGLIQLYLGNSDGKHLSKSHIGHFEEKGAITRFGSEASLWNWQLIKSTSGKIKQEIQKHVVAKHQNYDVLKEASLIPKIAYRV